MTAVLTDITGHVVRYGVDKPLLVFVFVQEAIDYPYHQKHDFIVNGLKGKISYGQVDKRPFLGVKVARGTQESQP